jgi:cation transport ATPase
MEGRPKVTDVVALGDASERDVLEDAAALDATSSHPIARAIVAKAQAEGIEVAPASLSMARSRIRAGHPRCLLRC